MQQKLDDFSSTSLILSIEESLREFWRNWGSAPQSELYDSPNLLRLYTGVPYAFCNGVICRQLSADSIEAVIDETVSYYRGRNAKWEWMVGPNSMHGNLDESLVNHGLSLQGESIGMAINLHQMSQHVSSIGNLKIIRAEDDETLETWANTMADGFTSPALYPKIVLLEQSLGYQQAYRRYLGVLDDRPVSTSALFLGENVAGIYCVSTLPKARGMGIGAAITQFAMREALAVGYHIAVLQSTQMGRTVYQRLGFIEYSTLRCYRPVE